MKTGAESRGRLMPETRKQVISWWEDIRPNTISTADRKPHGSVYIREAGSTLAMKRSTKLSGAFWSTSISWMVLNRLPSTSTKQRTMTAYRVNIITCLPM